MGNTPHRYRSRSLRVAKPFERSKPAKADRDHRRIKSPGHDDRGSFVCGFLPFAYLMPLPPRYDVQSVPVAMPASLGRAATSGTARPRPMMAGE